MMFDLGGIGIAISEPLLASPSTKPVTFFFLLAWGGGGEVVKSLLLSGLSALPLTSVRTRSFFGKSPLLRETDMRQSRF